jgi:Family of unknown function (DUF6263)
LRLLIGGNLRAGLSSFLLDSERSHILCGLAGGPIMRFARLPVGVLTLLLAASQAQAQTAVRWKWNQGEKLAYVLEDNYTSKSAVDREFFEITQDLILDTTWHVKRVGPSGEASIVVTIERVRFNTNGKGEAAIGTMSFDSKHETEPQRGAEKSVISVLKSLLGSEIALAVNAQGRVLRFDLPKLLISTMEDQVARELAGFFGDLFTADGLRHRLTNWLVALPTEPVSEKQSWQEDKPSRLGKNVPCFYSYTFAARLKRDGHTVIKIDVKPELKLLGIEADKDRPKITEQDGKGIVYFDNQAGRILESVVSQRVEMQMADFTKTKESLATTTTVKLATENSR